MTLNGSKCIKPRTAYNVHGLKASVTIEAAMALPFFILVFLTLSSWIFVLRTQEMVHCSLINAANTMALQNYTMTSLENTYVKSNNVITNIANTNIDKSDTDAVMNDLFNNLEKYNMDVSTNLFPGFEKYISSNKVETVSMDEYILRFWQLYEDIYREYGTFNVNGSQLFEKYLKYEFYKRANESYGQNAYDPYGGSNTQSGEQLVDKMLINYLITGGFGGIELSSKEPSKPWSSTFNSDSFTIKVRYKVKIPFSFQDNVTIPISQGVRVRPWGGAGGIR